MTDYSDLVRRIRDGEAEDSEAADAIEALAAALEAANAELGRRMDAAAVHYGGVISILTARLDAANADAALGWKWATKETQAAELEEFWADAAAHRARIEVRP